MFDKKKLAFTLTEVIVALTIIGIIATITIPRVMTNVKTRSDVVKLKNAYSKVRDALKLAAAKNGYDITYITALDNSDAEHNPRNLQDLLSTSFNAAVATGDNYYYTASGKTVEFKDKPLENTTAIQISDYSDSINIATSNDLIYAASNGALYIFKQRHWIAEGVTMSNYAEGNIGKPYTLYIDINGRKGPNEIVMCSRGEDVFGNFVSYNGYVSSNTSGYYEEPDACTVDEGAITDIYPFFVFNGEVAPATSAVVAVLER